MECRTLRDLRYVTEVYLVPYNLYDCATEADKLLQ